MCERVCATMCALVSCDVVKVHRQFLASQAGAARAAAGRSSGARLAPLVDALAKRLNTGKPATSTQTTGGSHTFGAPSPPLVQIQHLLQGFSGLSIYVAPMGGPLTV
jgi:hypothetical protein